MLNEVAETNLPFIQHLTFKIQHNKAVYKTLTSKAVSCFFFFSVCKMLRMK